MKSFALIGILLSFTSCSSVPLYRVGDIGPAGGWVFYDKGSYSNGWRYLEAAPTEQSTAIEWNNGSFPVTSATDLSIGSGKTNTATIISVQGAGSYASQVCESLIIDSYDDWFLPSHDELRVMCINLKEQGIGGFTSNWYWSSSEASSGQAFACYFNDNSTKSWAKDELFYVRAARYF